MTKHGKRKNDKDEIENILLKHVLPVYNLAQKGDQAPELPLPHWIRQCLLSSYWY